MDFIRVQSLLAILSHLIFIGLSYWSIQTLRTENLFTKNHPQQLKVFYLLLAIALGYTVSNFFLDFFTHSQNVLFFLR